MRGGLTTRFGQRGRGRHRSDRREFCRRCWTTLLFWTKIGFDGLPVAGTGFLWLTEWEAGSDRLNGGEVEKTEENDGNEVGKIWFGLHEPCCAECK